MTSLRRARIEDYWRKTFKRNYPTAIKQVRFSGENLFSGLSINLHGGILAIVGRNGVGKSNLVRILYNSFISDSSNRPRLATPLLSNGAIHYDLEVLGTQYSYSISIDTLLIENSSIPQISGFMYDPCILIPRLQDLFLSQNFEEILDGYSEVKLSDSNLEIINYLTHGKYDEVIQITIEDEFKEFNILPFFKVKSSNSIYDSRSMGLGELSLFYFFWLVDYINKFSENSLFFIEEPESFLPPNTQVRLANILAKLASERGISIFLSSHSEHILKRIPRGSIYVIRKATNGINCLKSLDNHEPLKLLGLTAPKSGILLFEDKAAEKLIKSMLKNSPNFSLDSFYYHKSGSTGNIMKDLERFPNELDGFKILGVFDGDFRTQLDKDTLKKLEGKNYCLLPSDLSPEKLLIQFFESLDSVEACRLLHTPEAKIDLAKEAVTGTDHHDYFYDLASELGFEFEMLIELMCNAWVNYKLNKEEVENFQKEVSKLVLESID